jgi:hypothetical protein
MVSPTAEKRAEELHQLEMIRLMRKTDQEKAQETLFNKKAE